MNKSSKKALSFVIKAVILGLAFTFIYRKYVEKGNTLKDFQHLLSQVGTRQVTITMSLLVIFMLLNWVLESLKWQYLTRRLSKISFWESTEAVFCGLTWAIFTPNRLGEYAGRVLFLPYRKRIYGVFAMAVGSFGQNVITNIFGAIGFVWYMYTYYDTNIFLSLVILGVGVGCCVLVLVLFFHIKWVVSLLDKVRFIQKYHRFFDVMGQYKTNELIVILSFCAARFLVFSTQYYFIIHLLVPQVSVLYMMMFVFIMFYIQSTLPSIDLFDVGVRGSTAAFLFAHVTTQIIAIVAAVSSIWFINLIIPAILGSVFVFKLNFFDRNV